MPTLCKNGRLSAAQVGRNPFPVRKYMATDFRFQISVKKNVGHFSFEVPHFYVFILKIIKMANRHFQLFYDDCF
jgi:hypothetical protein